MKNVKSLVLLFFSYLFTQITFAQSAIDRKYPVAELRKDVALLKRNLEQIHAGLYTYTSKSEFDTFFHELSDNITEPMTQIELYRMVLPLHNKIRNGHTLIIPPSAWSEAVEQELPHFPFDIYEDEGKVYVLRNLSDNETIQTGAEIVDINGVPAIQIYHRLIDNWTKDGYNRTFPTKIITQDFSEFYANVIGISEQFAVNIHQDGRCETLSIRGLPISKMRIHSKTRYQHEKRPWYNDESDQTYQLKIEGTTAALTIPTFSINVLEDVDIDYEQFFKKAFTEIKQKDVTDLIIDIRENGGGHGDVTTELFSYLYDQPFQLMEDIYTITQKIPNTELYEGSQFWTHLQMRIGLKKVAENKYAARPAVAKMKGLSIDVHQPANIQYSGRLYVLVSGWSFSASGLFTSLLKTHNKGIFIGEEAGGNPYVQVGDFEQMLTLPTSGIRMIIPLVYEKMNVNFENTGHGVKPHYPVRNSIDDELNNRDAVMGFTLDLIKNSNQKLITQQK
ncbi:MAG: S41 family peptidase [Bacteroidota bacterium]